LERLLPPSRLVAGAAGGFSGAVTGAEFSGINYTIHHFQEFK
jgi:hypothetical protein